MFGHSKDRCYKTIGYPPPKEGQALKSTWNGASDQAAKPAQANMVQGHDTFTPDQMKALQEMFKNSSG